MKWKKFFLGAFVGAVVALLLERVVMLLGNYVNEKVKRV